MIQFPCKCGYIFEVPQDLAGGVIQCPQCHLLADVPTLSDLANLNSDGTFAFENPEPVPDPMTAADLYRALTNKTTDSQGREFDLRNRADHLHQIGVEPAAPARVAPRYDPVTGELIRPLQFKDELPTPALSLAIEVDPAEGEHLDPVEMPTPVIPLPAPAPVKSLTYAVGDTRKAVTLKTLALELLMPANVTVMCFIYVLYVLGYFATIGIATFVERFLLNVQPFLLINLPMWLIFSHLGCILEDTGPDAIDEMPRPLRNFSFGDDFASPLLKVVLAIVLCFAPLGVALFMMDIGNPAVRLIDGIIAGLGAYFFPAVLLTSVTGSTVLNLRPDRVLEVVRESGLQYFASVILFILWAVPSLYYLGNELLFPRMLSGAKFFGIIERPRIMLPILGAIVYLMHFFGWHLGMIYRAHHGNFPWLAQRHVKAIEEPAPRRSATK